MGEDVPDGEHPQRRPRGSRWRRQDLARRGAPARSRGDPPPGQGRGRHDGLRLRLRRSNGAGSRCRSRSRRSSSTAQGQPDRRARATPTSSATSAPRCRPPTSRCSSCRRSKAWRCRPRSRGSSPRSAASRAPIFVNKLDRERASFARTLDQLKERFGAGVAPLHLPIGEEADVPRRRRAARRQRGHVRRRASARARRADPDRRWRSRSTRSTTRSSKASWSATTT